MTVQEAVLRAMENILGLDPDEMKDNLELNLWENELIDSLGVVTLLNEVAADLGKPLDIRQMAPEDLLSVQSIMDAVEKQTA